MSHLPGTGKLALFGNVTTPPEQRAEVRREITWHAKTDADARLLLEALGHDQEEAA